MGRAARLMSSVAAMLVSSTDDLRNLFSICDSRIGGERFELGLVKTLVDQFGLAFDDLVKAIVGILDAASIRFDAKLFRRNPENLRLADGLGFRSRNIV